MEILKAELVLFSAPSGVFYIASVIFKGGGKIIIIKIMSFYVF